MLKDQWTRKEYCALPKPSPTGRGWIIPVQNRRADRVENVGPVQNSRHPVAQQHCPGLRPSVINRIMDSFSATLDTLTLASASPIRGKLLSQVGITHLAKPVRLDEDAIRAALIADGATPRDIADALAEAKARKAAGQGLTLGCDQILSLKSDVFAKPQDRAEAAAHLARLSGQTHHLYSAAVLYEDGKPVWRHVGVARMTMHQLTPTEIAQYLERCWPDVAGCVGAYQAEDTGARLFSRIEGDWFSVLGLPLLDLCSHLRLRGWRFA
jgi:septum formation protein